MKIFSPGDPSSCKLLLRARTRWRAPNLDDGGDDDDDGGGDDDDGCNEATRFNQSFF